MTYAKTSEFDDEEVYLSEIAKVLSHPARIKIVKILQRTDSCMVKDIVKDLPLAQATVSQHLKELKRVGLIEGEIDGPKICYCLNKEELKKAQKAFIVLFKSVCC